MVLVVVVLTEIITMKIMGNERVDLVATAVAAVLLTEEVNSTL
jgi:hypothetical protein